MRLAVLLPLALLIACKAEPGFDERFDAAEKEIRDKAGSIDAELDGRASEAATPAATPRSEESDHPGRDRAG